MNICALEDKLLCTIKLKNKFTKLINLGIVIQVLISVKMKLELHVRFTIVVYKGANTCHTQYKDNNHTCYTM